MNILENLNDRQKEAVTCTEGPLLILAGAGSGKTRVLTHRIAYLMQEKGVDPYNIMAITFTNKAAGEMRERVNRIAGFGAEAVWVSTFHSACARILRRFADRIGYGTNFSIYDTDDSRQTMKSVLAGMEADQKRFPPKKVLAVVSAAKNRMMTPADLSDEAVTRDDEIYAEAYKLYDKELFSSNAMDFDDLLLRTVDLFRKDKEVLNGYQERLKYICIDEYQDTNIVQFEFVRMLAAKYRNLCVVGDDDQSIYKFRGADIRNILEFEKYFPDAHVVKLEQNYRSVGNILNGANSVIANNVGRKAKRLWTDKKDGDLIRMRKFETAPEEAASIVKDIKRRSAALGEGYSSFAVLYRTNAQSRLIEEQLIYANIPYQIIGGVNFYSRKEIKDVMAYLKTIANARDDLAVKRIINIPRRGIGNTTIGKLDDYARINGLTFYEALTRAGEMAGMGSAAKKIDGFVTFIRRMRTLERESAVSELIETILKDTGYAQELIDEDTDESRDRLANLDELISKARSYELSAESPTLNGFLEETALVADIDSMDSNAEKVLLMTIHSAKGLEFSHVYLAGMEDGLFPGFHSIFDIDQEEMEEERRLCYVGMTRAMKTLTLTMARERMTRGEYDVHKVSRFVEEIPDEFLDVDPVSRTVAYEKKDAKIKPDFDIPVRKKPVQLPSDFKPREFKVVRASSLDYNVGDRVRHKKFGEGTVADIKDGAKDYEVTVDFDSAGTRRLFASFAKLEKLTQA